MKIIELTFDDGERWIIPLEFVAKHRAEYYRKRSLERGKEDEYDYDSEIEFIMNDDYEGHDWLQNNMDYDDFKEVLKIIPNTNPLTKDWINAEAKIMDDETIKKING